MAVAGGTAGTVAEAYRAGQASLNTAVVQGVRMLWGRYMEPNAMTDSWEKLRGPLGLLIVRGQAQSANAGARYYNASRIAAGLSAVKVVLEPPPGAEQIAKMTGGTGIGAFLHQIKNGARWMDAYASAADSLAAATSRMVLSGGRHTVTRMSVADPDCLGWRRITRGTCSYCEELAAEGIAVDSASFPAHDHCECQAAPEFKGQGSGLAPEFYVPMSDEEAALLEEELSIDDPAWQKVMDFIGKNLSSEDITGIDPQYLNPDGTLNEGKSITKLLQDYKSGKPYDLRPGFDPAKSDAENSYILHNAGMKWPDIEKLAGHPGDQHFYWRNQAWKWMDEHGIPKTKYIKKTKLLDTSKTKLLDKFFSKGGDQIVQDALDKLDVVKSMPDLADNAGYKAAYQSVANDAVEAAKQAYDGMVNDYGEISKALGVMHPDTLDFKDVFTQASKDYWKIVKLNKTGANPEDVIKLAQEFQKETKAAIKVKDDAIAAAQAPKVVVNNLTDAQEIVDKLKAAYKGGEGDQTEAIKIVKEINSMQETFSTTKEEYQAAVDAYKSGDYAKVHDMGVKMGIIEEDTAPLAEALAKEAGTTPEEIQKILDNPKLHDAITKWKTSNSKARKQIQNGISEVLQGGSDYVSPDIKLIAEAIQKASTEAPALYRGMAWNMYDSYDASQWKIMEAMLKTGKLDMPAVSFSDSMTWPLKFQNEMKTGANVKNMMVFMEDGGRGLSVEELGVQQGEGEWYAGGKFTITKIDHVAGSNSWKVYVKQTKSLDQIVTDIGPGSDIGKPIGHDLISAISQWQGSAVELSKQAQEILTGKSAGTMNSQARALVQALKRRTEAAPNGILYRGMKWDSYSVKDVRAVKLFDQIDAGVVDLEPASFSIAKSKAEGFGGGGYSSGYARTMQITVKNARGFKIHDIGSSAYTNEKEYISGGKYEVVSKTITGNHWDVVLKQIAAYG